jgi:hypothetical protein
MNDPESQRTLYMKSTIFWDITPCSPLSVNRSFGGTYHLHLQGPSIRRARNQRESRWQAEQYARRNFGLCRKREGSGRMELSSGWLACRTEWNHQHPLALTSEPTGDKNQSLGWLWKGAVYWSRKKKTPWLWSASELCRPSDRRFLA